MSAFDIVSGLLAAEMKALLSRYGAECTAHSLGSLPPPRGRWIMASIGCSGQDARGALTLVGCPELWRAIAPPSDASPTDALLSDLAGETANMLMGRARNRLLALGLEVYQATPTCAFGDAIVLSDPGDALSSWHRFSTRAGDVHARFDAFFEAGLVLRPDSANAVQPCDSELVLF